MRVFDRKCYSCKKEWPAGWIGCAICSCWWVSAYTSRSRCTCVFHSVGIHIIYPILFGMAVGAVMALIVSLLPVWLGRLLTVPLSLLYVLLAEVQFIYHAIFGNFLSLSMVQMGDTVLEDFSTQLQYALHKNLAGILILLAPMVFLIIMLIARRAISFRMVWKHRFMTLLMIIVLAVGSVELMVLAKGESVSALNLLRSASASTDMSYQHLGMTATTIQELRFMFFGDASDQAVLSGEVSRSTYDPKEYNVVKNLDFAALYGETEDEELQAMDAFFSGREPTKKNQYTGALKGYNLITICAESFTPVFLTPELTPALWEMTHNNGFIFNNYYGTFQSVTTNGEYTFCTGLYPDLSRTKTSSSFNVAASNSLPFCLGNSLGAAGYEAFAYHNYVGTFYNRNVTHPQMGYTFKSPDNGLNITMHSPSSDLDMVQASVEDYIHSKAPFHAYYMTYSGHYQYSWSNDMSAKNRDAVQDLPYTTESARAFAACNLELEYAMEYLLDALEQAGQLDHTCIVLTNDHYPYGLSEEEYNDLAGRPIDTVFERYHNSFICYAPGLKQTIPVDAYCSTADILPTLLNLFGVPYDSRLLAGTDVLSDAEHIAVLSDESFLTADFRYDAATGTVTAADGGEVPAEELQRIRKEVSERFLLSREILNLDYYAHAFGAAEISSGEDETLQFPDLDSEDGSIVYYQAAISYLYNNGFVSPVREDYYGVTDDEYLARFLDTLYRLDGSPETTADALPEGYGTDENGTAVFQPGDTGYDAVCWAFETGILRASDQVTAPDAIVGIQTCARLLYRYALSRDLIREPTADDISALRSDFPEADTETLCAVWWSFQDKIIESVPTPQELMAAGNETPLSRGPCAMYLFRVAQLEATSSS